MALVYVRSNVEADYFQLKLASCPPGTQATSLDLTSAYHNSPIAPLHKKYVCILWKNSIYMQHVKIEGMAMAGGIQGNVVDTTIDFLKFNGVEPTIKCVDYFIL